MVNWNGANWRTMTPNIWWRHQMETFSALLVICAGNSPVTGEFPTQRQVTRSFDVSFDLCLNIGWVNSRETGGCRRHQVHYDAIVMSNEIVVSLSSSSKLQRGNIQQSLRFVLVNNALFSNTCPLSHSVELNSREDYAFQNDYMKILASLWCWICTCWWSSAPKM